MMRRKSERNKAKQSPESKPEKPKRGRPSRKRKKSSSSPERDSASEDVLDATVADCQLQAVIPGTVTPEKVQSHSDEENVDQVWHVKASQSSGDSGEIQKLKICLSRPSSTPERPDRSPRGRRKLNRSTSQADNEIPEDKPKTRHRSRRDSAKEKESRDPEALEIDTPIEEVTPTLVDTDIVEIVINEKETSKPKTKDKKEQPTTTNIDITPEKPLEDIKLKLSLGNIKNQESMHAQSNEVVLRDADSAIEPIEDIKKEVEIAEIVHKEVSEKKAIISDPTVEPNDTLIKHSDDEDKHAKNKLNKSEVLNESIEVLNEKDTNKHSAESEDVKQQASEAIEPVKSVDVKEDILPQATEEAVLAIKLDESKIISPSKQHTPIVLKDIRGKEDIKEEDKALPDSTVSTLGHSEPLIVASNIDETKDKSITTSEDDKLIDPKSSSDDVNTALPVANPDSKLDVCASISSDKSMANVVEVKSPDSASTISLSTQASQQDNIDTKPVDDVPKTAVVAEVGNIRKRRWGSRSSKSSKAPIVSISTDSLKNLISHVEPVSVEEVLLDVVKTRHDVEIKPPKKVIIEDVSKTNGKYSVLDKDADREIIGTMSHRKISIVTEEAPKSQRPPSPPKHKMSSILYITNLVRPFTILQLKNTLQRTGKIVENGFWIDKIKSQCYVEFETEDQAFETRHALHGVKWPTSNPKTLNVDFGARVAMDEALAAGDEDKPAGQEVWLKEQHTRDSNSVMEKGLERKIAVREWDLGKGETRDLERERERQANRNRDAVEPERRKRRSKTPSPSPARKFKKKEEEAPSKLLDDLFKKTKTTPCIYWLPLNAETILIKEEQRRKHMAEHERRLEELRRAAEEQRAPRHVPHHGSAHRHR